MAVAGRGFAFGVVFPDECFGCYFRNYCHGKRENGSGGVGVVDWSALTGCVVLFLVGAIAGWMVYVIKRKTNF